MIEQLQGTNNRLAAELGVDVEVWRCRAEERLAMWQVVGRSVYVQVQPQPELVEVYVRGFLLERKQAREAV